MNPQAQSILARLAQLDAARRRIEAEEKQLVGKARSLDVPWRAIDRAMGSSPGTTNQRWRHRFPGSRPVSRSGRLHIECPRCGAAETATCRTRSGKPLHQPHKARVTAAFAAQQVREATQW